MNILHETFTVGELLGNQWAFWIAYVGVLFLLRKPITRVRIGVGKGIMPQFAAECDEYVPFERSLGNGFLWTYFVNIPILFFVIKVLHSDMDASSADYETILSVMGFLSFGLWLFSPVTAPFLGGITIVGVVTCGGYSLIAWIAQSAVWSSISGVVANVMKWLVG